MSITGAKMISFEFSEHYKAHSIGRGIARTLTDREGGLLVYGWTLPDHALADILNQAKKHWSEPTAGVDDAQDGAGL